MESKTGTPGANVPEYSVGDIARAVKRTLEDAYDRVRVRGEISKAFDARSGHLYVTLKDRDAVLESVVWKGQRARLSVEPEEGLEVIATGRLTTFAGRSQYQLVIDALEPAGEGALLKLLEDRRKKLTAEGLFDDARKKPTPFLPDVVGVATSPQGAVIRDILHRLSDRFPRRVLVWPIAVQGEAAGLEAARAVAGFNALPQGSVPRPDVIIIARGGGSVEDLWGFNDEILCRTVAASDIPVVSAVGHETDVTLVDFAADLRAPTPTAAAELITPVRAELEATLLDWSGRLARARGRLVRDRAERLRTLLRILPKPEALVAAKAQSYDRAAERLDRAAAARIDRAARRLGHLSVRLSPTTLRATAARARARLDGLAARTRASVVIRIQMRRERSTALERRLDPQVLLRATAQRRRALGGASKAVNRAAKAQLRTVRARLEASAALLEAMSYEHVLARGFVLVRRRDDGALVKRAAGLLPGDKVNLTFADGDVNAEATATGASSPRPARRSAPKHDKMRSQSDLFDEGP